MLALSRETIKFRWFAQHCKATDGLSMEKTVLYAEDDPNDITLLQLALGQPRQHLNLQFVRDGAEAIEYLSGKGGFTDRKVHPLPDLIFLDVRMPKINGFEVLAWIRHRPRFHAIPVVLISSSSLPQDMDRAYFLGANAYVTKPAGFERLKWLLVSTTHFFLEHTAPLPPGQRRMPHANP
jgi:CheY-like chemotaxis protein